MKICICGKGGSGKSTVAAPPAGEFRRKGRAVRIVDSVVLVGGESEPPAGSSR